MAALPGFAPLVLLNESLDVPVTKSRNTKLLQICGSIEISCKSSVYLGCRIWNTYVIASCRQMLGLVQLELAGQALYIYRDCMQDYDSFKYKEYVVGAAYHTFSLTFTKPNTVIHKTYKCFFCRAYRRII